MKDAKDRNTKPLSFSHLALALAADYSNLYVINAGNDSYVEYAPSGSEKELIPVSSGDNFFADVPDNCRKYVWHEDQEFFLNAFHRESIMKALENGQSFSMTYRLNIDGKPRYFFLKVIRADDRNIIIGVRDFDAQKRRQLEKEKKSRQYAEIANSLASLFEVIYYVDMETDQFSRVNPSKTYAGLGFGSEEEEEDFFGTVKENLQRFLHPEDYDYVMHELERDVLLSHLHADGTVSLTYRLMINGEPQYMNLLAFIHESDTKHLVIGVRNVDAQKRRESAGKTYELIVGALASRYEVIYYIDADTNAYTLCSASAQYEKLGTTREGTDFFQDAAQDIRSYIHPDDRELILSQLQKETLLKNLQQCGTVSLNYRQMLDDRQQYMNMFIVQPHNDKKHIVMGVTNTDEQVRHEQTIRAESQAFSDISTALAQRYEVIYHVNILTNEYLEYSASEKYSRLKIGTTGKDFFLDSKKNMQQDIYSEDLPMMMSSLQKDNLLKSLSTFGKTILNYRLIIDGRAQYMSLFAVRPKEDSEHIIIAVANVDATKRMEIAYQNAMDLANRDALTGVKNKRAYVQTETDLDEQIQNSDQMSFAIVVCDVNGLKQVNDTQGHKAGDDYIRSACHIICETFKHSPVFRIGGDEFAVILRSQDHQHRSKLMEHMRQVLDEQKQNGMPLLAVGISEFDPDKDMRVQDVFERADALMYEDKAECKSALSVHCEYA